MAVKENSADLAQAARLRRERELAPASRAVNLVLIVLFALLIGGAAVLHFAVPDRDRSEMENRSLAAFPEFSFASLISGDFTDGVSTYLSDQFPARDVMVGVKAAAELGMGRAQSGGIIVSGDNLAARNDYPSRENLEENVGAARVFAEACAERGIPVIFAPAGRVCDVYPSRLPSVYGSAAQDSLWSDIDAAGAECPSYVPLRDVLREAAQSDDSLYYRTDHHWTTRGAYLAYRTLWESLPESVTAGLTVRGEDFFERELASDAFLGTAMSSSGAWWVKPDSIYLWRFPGDDSLTVTVGGATTHDGLYYREYLDVKDKYSVFLGENAGILEVTGEGERPHIVMIKDSFAQSLTPFFAADFNVTLIDPRYYSKPIFDAVCESDADAVIIIMNADTLTSDKVLRPLRRGIGK